MSQFMSFGVVYLQLWFIFSAAVNSPKNNRFLVLLLLGILLCMTHVFDNGQVSTPEILWNMHAMPDTVGCILFYLSILGVLCYLSNMKHICMCRVTWYLSCLLLYMIHCLFHFYMFIHLHLASHLGTLDKPCEGCDDGDTGMMEGLHKCCHLRCRQDGAS